MVRRRRRRGWWARAKEPLRWTLCFGVAGALSLYATIDDLLRIVVAPHEPDRPIQVRLWTRPRPPVPTRRLIGDRPDPHRALPAEKPEEAQRFLDDTAEARKAVKESREPNGRTKVVSPSKLRETIEEAVRKRAAEPGDPDQQLAKAKRLIGGVSAKSAREIAEFLAYQKDGEFVPKMPRPKGRFDFDDSVPYDIVRTAQPDGTPTYRITLVDRAGRTNTFLVGADDNPSQYDTLHRIFELSRDNPQLQVIVRRMVLPMLGNMRRGARAAAAPPPSRVPPPAPKTK